MPIYKPRFVKLSVINVQGKGLFFQRNDGKTFSQFDGKWFEELFEEVPVVLGEDTSELMQVVFEVLTKEPIDKISKGNCD